MAIKTNVVKWDFSSGYIAPLALVLIGFYFLGKQYGIISPQTIIWPWILVIIGVVWLALKFKK